MKDEAAAANAGVQARRVTFFVSLYSRSLPLNSDEHIFDNLVSAANPLCCFVHSCLRSMTSTFRPPSATSPPLPEIFTTEPTAK